jgi:putative ATP-binding cassette transporter
MMAVGAFNQVHASLRWFVDHIGGIADWRATLLRVAAFRSALLKVDEMHGVEKRIVLEEDEAESITLQNIEIASPAGCTQLSDASAVIGPGEHVIVTGGPGAGKTLFFRALAGLWPWGSGRIGLPAGEAVTFIPRTPYFPPGSLRDVLSYPLGPDSFADTDLTSALAKVGLDRFAGQLDRDARWDRELSDDEQRLLAFARLALHKPRWVVIDEALDTLKGKARQQVFSILEQDLAGATIINIGHAERNTHFFTRELNLVIDPEGRTLRPVRLDAVREPAEARAGVA